MGRTSTEPIAVDSVMLQVGSTQHNQAAQNHQACGGAFFATFQSHNVRCPLPSSRIALSFKGDLQSRRVEQKLAVLYRDHPQRDAVDLTGDIHFPNLILSQKSIDFGSATHCLSPILACLSSAHYRPQTHECTPLVPGF